MSQDIENRHDPKGIAPDLAPKGFWKWSHASGYWSYIVNEEVVFEISDHHIAEFQNRDVLGEPFIEFIEGTFQNAIVLRRIYKDSPKELREFLAKRGVDL